MQFYCHDCGGITRLSLEIVDLNLEYPKSLISYLDKHMYLLKIQLHCWEGHFVLPGLLYSIVFTIVLLSIILLHHIALLLIRYKFKQSASH